MIPAYSLSYCFSGPSGSERRNPRIITALSPHGCGLVGTYSTWREIRFPEASMSCRQAAAVKVDGASRSARISPHRSQGLRTAGAGTPSGFRLHHQASTLTHTPKRHNSDSAQSGHSKLLSLIHFFYLSDSCRGHQDIRPLFVAFHRFSPVNTPSPSPAFVSICRF